MNDLLSLADSPSQLQEHIDLRINYDKGTGGSQSYNPNSKMNSGYKMRNLAPSPNMFMGSETKVIMNGAKLIVDNRESSKTSCE